MSIEPFPSPTATNTSPTSPTKVNGIDKKPGSWPSPDPGWTKPENSKLEYMMPSTGISVMPTTRPIMSHTVRVLTPAEVEQLRPIFEERGAALPDPATSCVIGAVDSTGKVTNSFIVGQLRLHAEPLHLEPGNEHLFRPLVRALYDHVSKNVGTVDVFLFAPNDYIVKMAEVMGMEREPWTVMSSRIYANSAGATLVDSLVNLSVSSPVDPTDHEEHTDRTDREEEN